MNVEKMIEFPDLISLSGSKLYGTHLSESDDDYIGFILPPPEILFSLENFNQYSSDINGCDKTIYSLKEFFKLLLNGQTRPIEILFSNNYLATKLGYRVLENRNLFISKKYYRVIKGFSHSEFLKGKGLGKEISFRDKEEKDLIEELCGKFKLKSYQRDSLCNILYEAIEFNPIVVKKIVENLGDKRKENIEKFGYSPKNMSHAIRLLYQGIELLSSCRMTFPRPEADDLLQIKRGECSLEHIDETYNRLSRELDHIYDISTLQKIPDFNRINMLYTSILKDRFL